MERKEATRRLRNVLKIENIRSEYNRTPSIKPLLDHHNYGTDCFGSEVYVFINIGRAVEIVADLNEYKGIRAEIRGDLGNGTCGVIIRYIPDNIPASRGTKKVEV